MNVTIYHNPRCSKSRQTLQLLKDQGLVPTVVEYLKTPPSVADLQQLAAQLAMSPRQMMRTKEAVYKDLGLANADDAALVQAIADNPILLERPIVVVGEQARIGRPPENVLDILK